APMAEPAQVVTEAVAQPRDYRGSTTAIGTVLATRSISLRNELPGTVRGVGLRSGQGVEAGTVLVALDVSVEEAELRARKARAERAGGGAGRAAAGGAGRGARGGQRAGRRGAAGRLGRVGVRREADVARGRRRGVADAADARALLFPGAVGKIQPGHGQAGR